MKQNIRNGLLVLQIILLPICIAIAPGPMSKLCLTIATMIFMVRLWMKPMKPKLKKGRKGNGSRGTLAPPYQVKFE
jgi:hypothetical protein